MIIKTFLTSNRGKEYTARQIAEFINSNKFGLRKSVESSTITKLIKMDMKSGDCVLTDVEMRRGRNTWYYKVV